MHVVLVRHAAAITATARMRDEDRWLTEAGRACALRVGSRLAELGIRPTTAYTSPLVRAVQTTELLARALNPSGIEVHSPLAVDEGTPAQVASVLERHAPHECVILVTHEPKIRAIAALLGGIPRFGAFATAGAALFEGPRGGLTLTWTLDPESLVTSRKPTDAHG